MPPSIRGDKESFIYNTTSDYRSVEGRSVDINLNTRSKLYLRTSELRNTILEM